MRERIDIAECYKSGSWVYTFGFFHPNENGSGGKIPIITKQTAAIISEKLGGWENLKTLGAMILETYLESILICKSDAAIISSTRETQTRIVTARNEQELIAAILQSEFYGIIESGLSWGYSPEGVRVNVGIYGRVFLSQYFGLRYKRVSAKDLYKQIFEMLQTIRQNEESKIRRHHSNS